MANVRRELLDKLADDLEELQHTASGFLRAFEVWTNREGVSPYAWQRVESGAAELRRLLDRLESR